jgi:hypothetical protein
VQTVNCPNCGAEAIFRSPALPARVCDYCRTMIVRNGEAVTALGKAAVLPFDVSPVQIGMRGAFEGGSFDVVGRVRWGWTDGSWNEWLLLFEDWSPAWLGDAMGQFMLQLERPVKSIESDVVQALASGGDATVGTTTEVEGEELFVADAREAICIAAEGELPFSAPAGWRIYSIDFRSRSGRCATLQRDGGEASFYMGRYVSLEELKPNGLRRIEGWSLPAYGR